MYFFYCSPDRSYSICGPNLKGVGNDDFYETKSTFGVQIVQVLYVSVDCCSQPFWFLCALFLCLRRGFSISICMLAGFMIHTG